MKLKLFSLRSLFSPKPSLFPLSLSPQRCFQFPFCTVSNRRRSSHYFDDDEPGRSAVYHHALKFQRPPTIYYTPRLENTASFIGSVEGEVKHVTSNFGSFGVHTTLMVRSSNQPNRSPFWLRMLMWDRVAEIASEHLKPNDLICVSGCLACYPRPDDTGNLQMFHTLNVKKLEFVAQRPGDEDHKKEKAIEAKANDRNRLHLWQVFLANPNEWWDQRERKLNPRQPDFKHKDTGETLWLSKHDPPWLKRQLELLDSKMAAGPAGRRSRVNSWVYDE